MDETISLLPFIESGGKGFHLDIAVLDRNRISFQDYSYPFQIADKSQNLSILVKAGLKVNDSSRLKSLFLLVQRDDYPVLPDDLHPFTNAGIDKIWYDTMQSYSTDQNAFIIPRQMSQEGRAVAFSPLFYCKKQEKFFHPPCPECGTPLELCRDDGLLIQNSLSPFSTSLKRYLFCSRCHAAKTSHEFYQFSRSADDTVFIKDRFDLIKDFSKLRNSISDSFPCPDCPGHAECYITGGKAVSHISFFSFYPFYMIFFDEQPVKAVDFIPLISGAPFKGINTVSVSPSASGREARVMSREKPLFFFEGEKKFFLEVLFLKLSFFEEFLRSLFHQVKANNSPLINLSAQSIWIKPQSFGNNLPFFWSFKLSIIDLMVNSPRNYIKSELTKNIRLHFIASLWFYTFFVNRTQGQENVYEAIGKLLEKDIPVSDYDQLIKNFPAVAAENIFWNPEDRFISPDWHDIWLRIVETGVTFFKSPKDKGLVEELNQFISTVKDLKQEIKEELFSKSMEPEYTEQQEAMPSIGQVNGAEDKPPILSSADRQSILLILKQLKEKWVDPDPGDTFPDTDDEDTLETVVLSSEALEPTEAFDDTIEKTMVLPGPEIEPAGDGGFGDMEKTVIISSAEKPQKESDFSFEDDDLDKTVVITPKK